jgi:tetratricopeptide (TPR) repeat protein
VLLSQYALALVPLVFFALPATPATVLIIQFHNESPYADLNWVGESVAETMMSELSAANEIVLDRAARTEGLRRLSLRSDGEFTKATLIRLGQALDADYICYGSYDAKLPPNDSELKNSSVTLTSHFLDLRKMHDGADVSEAGKLSELSRLEEHMAWQSLKYLQPKGDFKLEDFLSPRKLIRVDAEESYTRGLLSQNAEQKEKWFEQAVALDQQFADAIFELGKLALARRDFAQTTLWLSRVAPTDPHYAEARFRLGLAAYGAGDFTASANYFREVAKTYPLNEVYNDLGAAEDRLNQAIAIDDFRRALDGDQNDATYLFNLGAALLKNNYYDESARRLQAVLDRDPNDSQAHALLEHAQRHENTSTQAKPNPDRLKDNFDATAFRELKAMLQPKGVE